MSGTNHYVVEWKIDVWADNPVDAARDAQSIQQQPIDWFFSVTDDEGVITKVDLENIPEDIPEEISRFEELNPNFIGVAEL